MTIEIRLLGVWDLLDAAVTLFRGRATTGARFLAQSASLAFAALAGDEIVGWAWGFREIRPDGRGRVLLYQLDTAESSRRRGIGSALVQAVIDRAGRRGSVASGW